MNFIFESLEKKLSKYSYTFAGLFSLFIVLTSLLLFLLISYEILNLNGLYEDWAHPKSAMVSVEGLLVSCVMFFSFFIVEILFI